MSITRRSFLQSMSAAMSAVAFGARMPSAIEPPKIRYDLFAETWIGGKWDIHEPFSLDGSIYATDSRVLITHPGEWSGGATGRVPAVHHLWWGEFDRPGWKQLPEQRLELRHPHMESQCVHCMATGRVGEGVHRALSTDEDGDDVYRWVGGTKCGYCNGTGWDESFSHHERLGNGVFAPGYMQRLRTLGGLDYRVIECGPRYCKESYVLLVRGDGGIKGMLMGIAE